MKGVKSARATGAALSEAVKDLDDQALAAQDLVRDLEREAVDKAKEDAAEKKRQEDQEIHEMVTDKIRGIEYLWIQPSKYGLGRLLLSILLSTKTLFFLVSLGLALCGPAPDLSWEFVAEFIQAYFSVARLVKSWMFGAALSVIFLCLFDLMEGHEGKGHLWLTRRHRYTFDGWYTGDVADGADRRADLGAVSAVRHKDPHLCYVSYRTEISWRIGWFSYNQTRLLISAELLMQLSEGINIRVNASPEDTAARLADCAARFQFVNLPRELSLEGSSLKTATALVAYGFSEHCRRMERKVPFPRSPQY